MVSIIIPIYNKRRYVRRCLESVQHQTFRDWECILVDNNSTDGSMMVCREFASDVRFRFISCHKQGVSAARNAGITEATGEWVSFIDADDWIEPRYLETMMKTAEEHPGYKAYTCCAVTKRHGITQPTIWNNIGDGERTKDEPENFRMKVRWATVWNGVWRAEVFSGEDALRFNTRATVGEDELVCLEYWMRYGKLWHTSYAGYHHHINETSISLSRTMYSRCATTLLCVAESMIHKCDNLSDEVRDNIRLIYAKKLCTDGIDYVVPYTINTPAEIKAKMQRLSYYYGDDLYDDDMELAKRYNKEEGIFWLQMRSIQKYMPWIRMIHLIVEDEKHVPEWIDPESVHIVYHRDFIPQEMLPTYNCNTIECYLGRIPFLANRFLYGNSDYVVMKPLSASDFFNGKYVRNRVNLVNTRAWQFNEICRSSYRMIFGRSSMGCFVAPMIHCLTPMVTERVREVAAKYEGEIRRRCTPFRSTRNVNQYIYPFYDMAHGWSVESDVKTYTVTDQIDRERLEDADVVCLEDMDDTHEAVKIVKTKLNYEK